MREAVELLRSEPRSRVFFAALTQSSLGTGAGYVALLLVAYDRFHSPWAISLVLAAELFPAMLFGPLFGAIADRFNRRLCLVAADLVRAGAFAGIVLVDDFALTVVFATIAGAGTALFTPAALAALPSVVTERRLPAATALYGAVADLGFTAGPALAGAVLLVGGPEAIVLANAVTFLICAAVFARMSFGTVAAPAQGGPRLVPALLSDARDGMRAAARLRGIRTVLVASGGALFFAGAFNVGELIFAKDELGAGDAGFSLLVAALGVGFIAGSLTGSSGGGTATLKRGYLTGLGVMGGGLLVTGLAPGLVVAVLAFAAAGWGNGMVLVYERLLIQATVPDEFSARIYGVKDSLSAWAFGAAFAGAGAVIALAGVRPMLVAAGSGGLLVWVCAVFLLRQVWGESDAASDDSSSDPAGGTRTRTVVRVAGEQGANAVGGRDHWLALLDDLREHGDDPRIELRPRVPH
jgi:MFS family permease